jgi:Icc-related predicted phosphoesterase
MRMRILSDLHLEFAPFQPADVDADVIVLAGDIHTGRNGLEWILRTFPSRPVIYILGNHEFYGHAIPKLALEIKDMARGTNVHLLENDCLEIGNIVFLGATLWTDFGLSGDPVLAEIFAQRGMTDFQRIRLAPGYRRFHPCDARRLHTESFAWLAQQAQAARGKKLVLITHHAPSPRSIPPRFQNHPLNPAFASNLEPFVAACGAALWIHGHIHEHSDYPVGGCRVLANPRGYPNEPNIGFDPTLVIDV